MYLKRLRDVPLFAELGKRDLEALSQLADELDVDEGRALAREGEMGHEFFVIEAGTAEVTRGGDPVAELGPGDFFGEVALIEKDRRNATVTAKTAMTVIVLTAHAFRSLQLTQPRIFSTVKAEIEKRRPMAA